MIKIIVVHGNTFTLKLNGDKYIWFDKLYYEDDMIKVLRDYMDAIFRPNTNFLKKLIDEILHIDKIYSNQVLPLFYNFSKEENINAMQCPKCDKWVPSYCNECYNCSYDFLSSNSCDYEEKEDYYSSSSSSYSNNRSNYGAKQCCCGKWVPSHSKQCWTCRNYFY